MTEFLKRFWAQILLIVAAVLGLLAVALGSGRRRPAAPEAPSRPTLTDVKIPIVNTDVSDDYVAGKEPVTTDAAAVVDEINARHR
jgi:hypothetical protein